MEKNQFIKWAVLTAVFVTVNASASAQQAVASASADFVSSYIWRGQDLGGISVQPAASLSVSGVSLTAWGSVGFDSRDTKEFDFTVSYSARRFNAAITDYWFNTSTSSGKENSYYDYGAHTTAHMFEATVGYDFGVMAAVWNTYFAGADYYGAGNKRAYSTYLEASAPFRLGGLDLKAELGLTPWEGLYANQFDVVNMGLTVKKEIRVTDSFAIPAFTKVVFNPTRESCRFVFGITF